ncbi:hypothetical protein KUTeg_021136 [Tegillarca granosa]|uniref:CN hydrolase domain-containing protein n=1 Tax=Tegillarca granosa TaxID=220873 RepID=A0ABQ9E9X2_TEGGR|nr:hypothetical protein KUTeg_021136 [Tegillarca granosa]
MPEGRDIKCRMLQRNSMKLFNTLFRCTLDKKIPTYCCFRAFSKMTAKELSPPGQLPLIGMVFLPEAADFIGESKKQSNELSESIDGEMINRYKQLAKDQDIWISVGSFHQKDPAGDSNRVHNTQVIIDSGGNIQETYSKTHLFDLDIKGKVRLCESDYTVPGDRIVPPVTTPVGKVGLAIVSFMLFEKSLWNRSIWSYNNCYDLRFPELSLLLSQQGAEIITYPSAFTQTTGMAHWETYVVAAAQTGKHNDKRSSYGHAMIIDPWGTVIAQCHEGTDVCVAEIDISYLRKIISKAIEKHYNGTSRTIAIQDGKDAGQTVMLEHHDKNMKKSEMRS